MTEEKTCESCTHTSCLLQGFGLPICPMYEEKEEE